MRKEERHALFVVAGFLIIFAVLAFLFFIFNLHFINYLVLSAIFFVFLWHYIKKNFPQGKKK